MADEAHSVEASGGAAGTGKRASHAEGTVKDTLISMVISLAMALVAKAYVVEAFVIPTGSMAPTLLGQHMRFQSEETGYEWTVNPWHYLPGNERPFSIQGRAQGVNGRIMNTPLPVVTDPMSTSRANGLVSPGDFVGNSLPVRVLGLRAGFTPEPQEQRTRTGDRILVHKYLYHVLDPQRYDVVVFKNPENARENYIKRLIGLPNEQVVLVDGDVFTRPGSMDESGAFTPDAGTDGAWRIQRKPTRVQRAVWAPIFSSEYTPLRPVRSTQQWFTSPWQGRGWDTNNGRTYRSETAEPTVLAWDTEAWPINDWTPYNETPRSGWPAMARYATSDLRVRAGVRADVDGLRVSTSIRARQHEFEAVIEDGQARLRMRPVDGAWADLGSPVEVRSFAPGRIVDVEFWHVDQALRLYVGGRLVTQATYDWTPSERMQFVTGLSANADRNGDVTMNLRNPLNFKHALPEVRWTFSGSPVTLFRVGLDRDLYYRAAWYRGGTGPAGLGTRLSKPVSLDADEFFCLGDNSAASKDGRLWELIDPSVEYAVPGLRPGVVHRRLMLGKAFFVYWPSTHQWKGIPVPNFGDVRFIR
ncbi:MAG: signal peptidase I [Planctomycetota bacterium]